MSVSVIRVCLSVPGVCVCALACLLFVCLSVSGICVFLLFVCVCLSQLLCCHGYGVLQTRPCSLPALFTSFLNHHTVLRDFGGGNNLPS